jgi:4-hydroxy-3-methylbut-2-en-1-yl diphosphate reductase
MKTRIIKLQKTGFCSGVKRAIEILEKLTSQEASVDCLGELVHNPQVMHKLKEKGVRVIQSPQEVSSPAVAISAHGVSPEVEAALGQTEVDVYDATCPSVTKVQKAARRMAENGYSVVVFGDAKHTEVKGILGWADGKGQAVLDVIELFIGQAWPHKIGLLSQTTQVPENYLAFVKAVLDRTMKGNCEITILDTICREVRQRQELSSELADQSDLMLVVGGKNSANSRRLAEICALKCETHLIENAGEVSSAWLADKKLIGITSGTSTAEETIEEVYTRVSQLVNERV